MAYNSGKVYMSDPTGKVSQWVDGHEVDMFKKEGFKVLPVRLRQTSPTGNVVERTFMSDRVPSVWKDSGSVSEVPAGQEGESTPVGAAIGNNLKSAFIETGRAAVPAMASMMVPGVGALPALARLGVYTGVGGGSNMAADAMQGREIDPATSFTQAGVAGVSGLPFEAAANYLPKWAPRMVSDVLRPSASQQKAMEAVAKRQGTSPAEVDYDRAAQQLLAERTPSGGRVMPNKQGAAALESMNQQTNQSVNDILDMADASGFRVAPTQLVRSPEIAQLRRDLRKEVDGNERVAALTNRLKAFLESRATKGTPNTPATPPKNTGLFDQHGNPIQTPGTPFKAGQPRQQKLYTARKLGAQEQPPNEGEKAVWRRGAATVNRARSQGTSTDKQLQIDALVDDALARAAVRHLEHTGFTTADPERAGQQIGVDELNQRLERRIPLEETVKEHLRRPPMSFGERIGLIRGRLPFPDAAVLRAAYGATNPGFVPQMMGGAAATRASIDALLNAGRVAK